MDPCTNCGALLRPGARFCTTCGSRLNEKLPDNDGWGTPTTAQNDDSQETSVLSAITPPEESPSLSDNQQRSHDQWAGAFGNSRSESASSTTDPASRFRSALDTEVRAIEDDQSPSDKSESTWGSVAPVFTPPPPSSWNYRAGDEEPTEAKVDSDSSVDTPEQSEWQAPATWLVDTEANEHEAIDVAGLADDGDANTEGSEPEHGTLPPDEARDKAIALADELRRTIRMMSSGGETDHGAAAMVLTEASLSVSDFSDVRGVLADVKNDPRDIRALSQLAEKVERLESLLDEHASLADTIEKAIKDLTG